jgi:CRP-like cAMP-binding protein
MTVEILKVIKDNHLFAGLNGELLDVYDAGDVFGKVGVLDFGPRAVDAVAETRTELFRLEWRQFLKHLHSIPELCFRIFSLLCNELRESTAALEDTEYRSVGSPWTGDTQVDIPSCPQVDVPSSTQNANERRPKRIERRSSERMVCVNQGVVGQGGGVGLRTKSPMLIQPMEGLPLPPRRTWSA